MPSVTLLTRSLPRFKMHEDSVNEGAKKPSWFNIASLVLAAFSFFGGHVVTVITGWATKNEQLSSLSTQMNKLSNSFDTFMERYNQSHETTSNDIISIK